MFASLVEYAGVSFEIKSKIKRGMELPAVQTESDDCKVRELVSLMHPSCFIGHVLKTSCIVWS